MIWRWKCIRSLTRLCKDLMLIISTSLIAVKRKAMPTMRSGLSQKRQEPSRPNCAMSGEELQSRARVRAWKEVEIRTPW